MNKTHFISCIVVGLIILGAGCREDCSKLSIEECASTSGCYVERSHIMGADGQHNEEVACVAKR